MNNQMQPRAEKVKFSLAIQTPAYKKLINNTLGDPDTAKRFIASITSTVAVNPALQECDAGTILSAALLGESLKLSPSPQLGHFYMVPFNDKKNDRTVATFQLGYKGYIQLAIRSGQYRHLNVIEIKEGELIYFDRLNEEIQVDFIQDERRRKQAPTEGYYAYFELMNGFKKGIYWTKEEMVIHAETYSQAFGPRPAKGRMPARVSFEDYEAGNYDRSTDWVYSSFWYKDFDAMAKKTMLRQLISKWGIMSIEMQQAYESDMTFQENGEKTYFDAGPALQNATPSQEPIEQEEPEQQQTIDVKETAAEQPKPQTTQRKKVNFNDL